MSQYESEIKKSKTFKKAKEIARIEGRKPITLQVTTEEDWIYWVTEEVVDYRGLQAERGIYVSQNGSVLSFFDNEEEALNNKDREEHYYGDISKTDMRGNNPWKNEKNNIEKIVIVNEIEPINMSYYFDGLEKLKEIENIEKINTSRVVNMKRLFNQCKNLITLDISSFKTSNVTDMSGMFSECNRIETLDLSNFDTSKVTNMQGMFFWCSSLKSLNISNFNTSNVINMEMMFYSCGSLKELDISSFDTSKVTNMSGMFFWGQSLKNLNISNFNTSNVTDMSSMFGECGNITTLDLKSFDTSKVVKMNKMFICSRKLTSILVGPNWKVPEDNSVDMFKECGVSEVTIQN